MNLTNDTVLPPSGVEWNVRLLGRLEVLSSSNKAVRFRSRTALYLLAYLLLNQDKEHSNDYLQALFWPESDGDRQAQNLRRAVADLRKVLETDLPLGSVVVTRKGLVSLNRDRFTTDVERFHSLSSQADDEDETARLSEAVSLYQGPLLAPITEEWVISHRMELEERFGQAVDRLCASLDKQGDVKQAICTGRAAIVVAPCREDVHIALIRAYNSAGMQVEALRQFEELERILDETWGEAPSAAARGALDAGIATRRSRHNLPEELTSFIGREQQIEEVCELLTQTRLLTLTGSGGCGKTRLSLQAASKVLDKYHDGVWLVEFAPLADPALVPKTIAAALGLTEQPGKSIDQALLDFLSAKQLLLVLDNCEHLLLACAQVVEAVLRQCPFVAVLANSREGLAIGGELIYHVPSLSLPNPKDPQTPENLAQCESVQLFVERARQVHAAFAVTGQNAPAVASVCHRLDGIPLAIELAAARLRTLSVEEVNQRLDQRFRLLTGGSRTALPRQQTLRSLIDWSYDLLSDTEKALFCRLAVFAGGWSLESAEQICTGDPVAPDTVLDLLTSLCDKNLVGAELEYGAIRYRMLETVRQYARDRLLECGEVEKWRDRHLAHCTEFAERASLHLDCPDQQAWLVQLDSEHDNIRSALEWSSAPDRCSEASLRLAEAVYPFWYKRSHLSEGRRWVTYLLAAGIAEAATAARSKLLHGGGVLAWAQGDYTTARRMLVENLSISRELGDRQGIALSLNILGNVVAMQTDFETARTVYEESLEIMRELGDQKGIAGALHNLGSVARSLGNYTIAQLLLEEGLTVFRGIGNQRGIGYSLMELGTVNLGLGNYEAARLLLDEGLSSCREAGDLWSIGTTLCTLGQLENKQGDYRSARTRLEEGLAIFMAMGHGWGIAFSLEGLVSGPVALAWPDQAARILGAAEQIRKDVGTPLPPHARLQYDQQVVAARKALGDDEAFDRAWQEGRALTLEQAVELALAHDFVDA